jgi:hypothetical protein
MRPRVLATLLTLILALALGASGPMRAFAHGHQAGLTAMVICGEDGATTVYLDAAGNPVDPHGTCLADSCTDCMTSGPTVLGAFVTLPVPPGQARALLPQFGPDRTVPRWTSPAKARGPPTGEDLA